MEGHHDSQAEALLRDQRLNGITFVLDYLQMSFDGQSGAVGMNVLSWPTYQRGDLTLRFGDAGYRDALCGLIEQHVERLRIDPEQSMEIRLSSGAELRIPLVSVDRAGTEAVLLNAPPNQMWVWHFQSPAGCK